MFGAAGGLPPTDCPPRPSITCPSPAACSNADDYVLLRGSCKSSDPAATLVYSVGGARVVWAKCPAVGDVSVVSVRPVYKDKPLCSYDAVEVFTLTSG